MRLVPSFLLVLAVQSGSALAVMDVEVLGGKGASLFDDGAGILKPSEADLASASFHIAPIALVPVAFGVETAYRTFDATFSGEPTIRMSGWSLAPELMTWIPGLTFSPYAKISTTAFSRFRGKSGVMEVRENSFVTQPGKGTTQISGGLRWSPLPTLSLLGEYRRNIRLSAERSLLFGLGAWL